MKTFKITIALLVLAAMGAGIFFWIQSIKDPIDVKPPQNQFTLKIEQEIEQLKAKPENKFCKDFYNLIAYHINDYYKQGRFGKNEMENNKWKENLEKTLYSVYADIFIKQAKSVLKGSEWKSEDLKFIQAEKNLLKKSKFLLVGSPVDKDFMMIQTTLNKYNEIVSFISSCKGYDYPKLELSARFPIADVQSKITRAASLRQKRLENELVNNCTRLHNGLKEIPASLFRAHVRYLDNKINNWSGLYPNYNSQSDYSYNLYRPLKSEIEALDIDIYDVPNFDSEYDRLLQKWSADNSKAYNHRYR